MGRKVKTRIVYVQDATFLRRLIDAVNEDERPSTGFKSDVTEWLTKTIALLNMSPNQMSEYVSDHVSEEKAS